MNIGMAEENAWEGLITSQPECKPFKKASWEIFDDIESLQPEKAKGTHSFHATSGSHGHINTSKASLAPASSSANPNDTPAPTSPIYSHSRSPSWDNDQIDATMAGQSTQSDPQLTISQAVTSSQSSISTPQKHPAPVSAVSSKCLKQMSSNAEAIRSLGSSLERFGDKFKESTDRLAAAIHASPEHKALTKQARDLLDEKEDWLTSCQKVILGWKFEDHHVAHSYIDYADHGSPSLKTWVAIELDIAEPFSFDE
jgi:hypothetical protein